MMNFYRNLPREIEESAFIDGADHLVVLIKLYVPLSAPAVATVALFSIVGHWNSWFDGLIYLNTPSMYPLQTFLYMIGIAVTQGLHHHRKRGIHARDFRQDLALRPDRDRMVPVLVAYPSCKNTLPRASSWAR